MSDEALNAHLEWMDKCAEEQANECEHVWGFSVYFPHVYCVCGETMSVKDAEAILNEHAALKRENEALKNLLKAGVTVLENGLTLHQEWFDLANTLLTDKQFTGGTTPTYFSGQDKDDLPSEVPISEVPITP